MCTVAIRSEDCLKNRLHLKAFDFRPPPSTKRHGKKMATAINPSLLSNSASASASASLKPCRSLPAPPPQTQPPPKQQHPKQRRQARRNSACAAEKNADDAKNQPWKPLVMEEVRILRRGEDLTLSVASLLGADRQPVGAAVDEGSDLTDSVNAGISKQLMSSGSRGVVSQLSVSSSSSIDQQPIAELCVRKPRGVCYCYAGAGFYASPEPISLPIPRFLLRKADPGGSECDKAKK